MYNICMKRINIILSDELAEQVEDLAERKETTVAEVARRSLRILLAKVSEKNWDTEQIAGVWIWENL